MSLLVSMAGIARSLIGPAGLAGVSVTLTRSTPGSYDPLSGTTTSSAVSSWAASAIEVATASSARPTDAIASSGQRVALRTFTISGLGIPAPQSGDTLTVAGAVLRIASVTAVARLDAVTAPLYRVECVA